MTITDMSTLIARKYEVALWEGVEALRALPEKDRMKIIQFIADLMIKEIRAVLDGDKDVADAPFAALVDAIYQENTPRGCYFCDRDIDGNEEPFEYPQKTKLCLTCQMKVANLLQAFGITPRSLFPDMSERKIQTVKYTPFVKEEGVRH